MRNFLLFMSLTLLVLVAFAFWRMFLWIEKRVWQLKARDEWIELLKERELDAKYFADKYRREPLDRNEYFYLHKYYEKHKDEDVVKDAGSVGLGGLHFPDFIFDDKDLKV